MCRRERMNVDASMTRKPEDKLAAHLRSSLNTSRSWSSTPDSATTCGQPATRTRRETTTEGGRYFQAQKWVPSVDKPKHAKTAYSISPHNYETDMPHAGGWEARLLSYIHAQAHDRKGRSSCAEKRKNSSTTNKKQTAAIVAQHKPCQRQKKNASDRWMAERKQHQNKKPPLAWAWSSDTSSLAASS